jgi:sigma-B regulation protein RsbU (phosphoserine phosphatase)
MTNSEISASGWLVPLFGPPLEPIELVPREGGSAVGRHRCCDIRLASERVSRLHARVRLESGRWRLEDLGSKWGTFLNGCRLTPTNDVPLNEGDLIRITPWTFCFSASTGERDGIESRDDLDQMQTAVRSVPPQVADPMAGELLALLLESAEGMHAAEDEKTMAEVMLDAACRGTGLGNAAVLRPLDAVGRIEVVASRHMEGAPSETIYSRSLLAAASRGTVAVLGPDQDTSLSESIVQMQIHTAICVPLMLGSAVAVYLYLDSRGGPGGEPRDLLHGATAFCVAIGRIGGLALANLKRIDIERRQALIEAELSAGAEAQRWILPPREKQVGPFRCLGESRPGRHLGGDFFDVVQLGGSRVAVVLGDVCGKGIAASVLMTAAQGFLHASLQEHGQPERAVRDLNSFVFPRRPTSKFITLWVGVFDAETSTLCYVDAGHGHALLLNADGTIKPLSAEGGMPVGVSDDAEYTTETVSLTPSGRALVVSDGIIDQPAAMTDRSETRAQRRFKMAGVKQCLAGLQAGEDEIAALFRAVEQHAGTVNLSDDATAALLVW